MANCVEKLSHSCGSGDGLQVFEKNNVYTGYCFSCGTYVDNPYEGIANHTPPKVKAKTEVTIQEEIREITGFPSVDLPTRALKAYALAHYGVKVALSEQDGQAPITVYFPYKKDGKLSGYKVRPLTNKKMWSVGDTKSTDLFGWDQALASGAKRLYITEGEYDAIALFQALKDKNKGTQWKDFDPAVASLPSGAGSAKASITTHMKTITNNFNEVVLVFDKDEVGQQAVEAVMQVLPTARTVELPAKDANAAVIEGRSVALCNAVLFKSSVPKNTRLVWGQSLYETGREQAKWGLSWPWEKMTDLTRGIRFGETIYIGAGVKMGKSEVVKSLAKHFIIEHDMPVFMACPEESNKKTYQQVLGKIAGKIFHDPKIPFDYEAYDAASKQVENKLLLLDLYQHMGWDTLRPDIIAATQMGCRAVFIDPITNLTSGIASGDANTKLEEISKDLSALAKDLDIAVFLFCHLKAPTSGEPHERGGEVRSNQFTGSRAMMRSCNYMIGMEGNKHPDFTLEQKNLRTLVLLEDREFGNSGKVRLYWDHMTGLFNEIEEEE